MWSFKRSIVGSIALLVFLFAGSFALSPAAFAQFKQQGSKLLGNHPHGPRKLGFSVALSADGNTAIVGAPNYEEEALGAVWVLTRKKGIWTVEAGRLAGAGWDNEDPERNAVHQGSSVALSADGNTALSGGPGDANGVGATWVFVRENGIWHQQGGKLVGTGSINGAGQGRSVALSADGNTAIIGGDLDNSGVGGAWIFVRDNGVWAQQGQKLLGTGVVGASALQGTSVALSADGNTAMVGGRGDNSSLGAAWIFTRNNGAWNQQGSKLVGTNAGANSEIGDSVALSADGRTALVGAARDNSKRGALWVFTRKNGIWTQQGNKLVGVGAVGNSPREGASVALSNDGNTAALGGPADNSGIGAVWIFTRHGDLWKQQDRKLVGTRAVKAANQGSSVALSGDGNTAMIGGPGDWSDSGAVWIFVEAPSVNSLHPAAGSVAGHTTVTIRGKNFTGATTVNFGGHSVASFRVVDSTTIVAHTRKHPRGKVTVTVKTSAGTVQKAKAFDYR